MFCKNCGVKLDDTASFCPHCGTKLTGENTPAPSEAVINPSDSLPPAEKTDVPFKRVWLIPSDVPDEAYRHPFTENPASRSITATIALLRSARAYKDSQYPYFERVNRLEQEEAQTRNWLQSKGTGLAFGAAGLFLLFLLFVKWSKGAFHNDGFFGPMPFIGTVFLLCSLGSLAGAVCVLIRFIRKFTDRGRKQQRLQEIEAEICGVFAEFQRQLDDEGSPVQVNAMNYGWLFPTLNVTTYQISHMIHALESGRAGTFQDALLHYDRCMHEIRMENAAEEAAEYARQSAAAAERTAEAAEAAAAATASMNITATRIWAQV